jgi:hypothetical protein
MDSGKVGDAVNVGLESEAVSPVHPCAECGVETKDTGTHGWRFCSDCDKRLYVGLNEAQLLALMEDRDGYKARVQALEAAYKAVDLELTDKLRLMRERGWI